MSFFVRLALTTASALVHCRPPNENTVSFPSSVFLLLAFETIHCATLPGKFFCHFQALNFSLYIFCLLTSAYYNNSLRTMVYLRCIETMSILHDLYSLIESFIIFQVQFPDLISILVPIQLPILGPTGCNLGWFVRFFCCGVGVQREWNVFRQHGISRRKVVCKRGSGCVCARLWCGG
jgi:hypothetical protein